MVALVRNPAVTLNAYGSYVTPIPGNIGIFLQQWSSSKAILALLGKYPEIQATVIVCKTNHEQLRQQRHVCAQVIATVWLKRCASHEL